MSFHHDPHAQNKAMTHLAPDDCLILKTLEQDWRRMSGNDVQPIAASLDPKHLDSALPHAFVLRRVGPGTARFRVAGQRLHDLLRMDPRGMPFSAFFTDKSRETAMEMLEAAFTLPAIVAMPLTAPRGFGRKPVRATALLLPMRDSDGEMTRMLGAIVTSGDVSKKVHQFDIDHTVEMRCETLDGHFPDRRSGARSKPAYDAAPARGHLRLVVDNVAV